MKKKLLSILLCGTMIFSLTACGGGSQNPDTPKSNPDTESPAGANDTAGTNNSSNTESADNDIETNSATERKEVSMVIFSGGGQDTFDKAAEEFNSRQDKIKLSIQPATGDYNQFLGARTASGDLPDMFWLSPYAQVQQFANNDLLMDLSDQPFVDEIYDYAMDSCTYDGKVYAYPLRQEFLGIFYNKDLFSQAGIEEVPKTFTDFKAACEKLDAAGITPLSATYKDDWTLNHAFSCLEGATVGDDYKTWLEGMNTGSGTFETGKSGYVFDFMDLMKEYSGKNFMDADSTAGFSAFASGDTAMLFSGEFSLLNIPDINPDLPVGLFAVPATDDPADAKLDVDVGVTCVISKDTKNPEACLEVLSYLSDSSDDNGWFNATNNAMGEAVPCMPWEGTYTADYMDDYRSYMESDNTRPWIYQQLPAGSNTEIGKIIQGYFANTIEKEQVIPELDKQIGGLVK